MTLEPGQLPDAHEVSTRLAWTKNVLRAVVELEEAGAATFTQSDFDNWTWDRFSDQTMYDEASSSNIHFNTTTGKIILLHDETVILEDYDFTGVSRDTDWSTSDNDTGTGSSTLTFDSANDEEDFSGTTGGTSSSVAEHALVYDTSLTHAVFKVHIQNFTTDLTSGAGDNGVQRIRITLGSNYAEITNTNGGNWFWKDSEAGSVDTTSATFPTDVWLKLTVRKDGSFKSEYSTSATDTGYTTLTETDAGSTFSAAPTLIFHVDNVSQARSHTMTATVDTIEIVNAYQSTGTFVADAVTAGDTINAGLLIVKDTTPANTSMTYSVSADNGSNYESHTPPATHTFSNTGTQLKVKAVLATSDQVSTPEFEYYAYQWTEG